MARAGASAHGGTGNGIHATCTTYIMSAAGASQPRLHSPESNRLTVPAGHAHFRCKPAASSPWDDVAGVWPDGEGADGANQALIRRQLSTAGSGGVTSVVGAVWCTPQIDPKLSRALQAATASAAHCQQPQPAPHHLFQPPSHPTIHTVRATCRRRPTCARRLCGCLRCRCVPAVP